MRNKYFNLKNKFFVTRSRCQVSPACCSSQIVKFHPLTVCGIVSFVDGIISHIFLFIVSTLTVYSIHN